MPQYKNYRGITKKELRHLKSALKKAGLKAPQGDRGALTYKGVEILVTYNEDKETLKVSISKKPFYIPEALVWDVIDTAVKTNIGH